MKKNDNEKLKKYEKEFDEDMLIQGNKMYFVLMLIYTVLLVFNYSLYLIIDKQFEKSAGFVFGFGFGIIYFIANVLLFIKTKGKLKSYRYILLLVAIINYIVDISRGYIGNDLDIYILYILFSLVYLDCKFSVFSSVTMGGLYFFSIILSILKGNNYFDVFSNNMYMILVYLFVIIVVVYLSYAMRKKMINYNILKDEKTKEERDYVLATKIQDGLLSKDFETNDYYNYFATMYPAKIVGGDFYDFYYLDENHLVITIGDVSGKGVPASLFMASAKNTIKGNIQRGVNFVKSFNIANKSIIKINQEMQFITIFTGIIDLSSGDMFYVNAGHCKPVVVEKNGMVKIINSKPDMVFGVRKNMKYHMFAYKLNEGDKLLLYTDGVIERYNDREELYGIERLVNFLKENAQSSSKELLMNLKANLDNYSCNEIQNDDITCLAFELSKYSEKKESVKQEFNCKKNKMSDMMNFINEIFDREKVSENIKTIFNVVMDEFISNIIKYAYDIDEENQYIRIEVLVNNKVIIKLVDKGKYFNPLEYVDTILTSKVKVEDKIGGLGIKLSFNMVDDMKYSRVYEENILTIIKEFE